MTLATIRSPATRLRSLRVGDTWRYQVAGRIVPPTDAELPLVGEITVSVAPDRLPELPHALLLIFAQTLHAVHPDGKRALPAPSWMFAFVQDKATGDVAIVADTMALGGAWRIAETPQVFYPGAWSGATAYTNRLTFAGGDFVANTLAVTGPEALTTPAGGFLSWVAEITSESPALGSITGTDWWVPELGAPARFETASRMPPNPAFPDGARMLLQATLGATNVAPGDNGAG